MIRAGSSKPDRLPVNPVTPVTPGGHGLGVWAAALGSAPRVPADELAAALVGVDPRDRPSGIELVVVSAHPDDETLGLGRLAHQWGQSIGPVTGVLATAGEACVDHVMKRPPGLAARRVAEWHAALDELGFISRHVLDLPDGQVGDQEQTLTAALTRIVADATFGGRAVVLAAPWRADPHPDHRAAGRAAATVAAAESLPLVEYPVWMTYWAEPTAVESRGQQLVVVPHDAAAERAHHAACRSFTSQLEPLIAGATPVVPATMLAHLGEQLLIVSRDQAAVLSTPGVPA